MKLQDICNRIKKRYDIVFGNDFIIKAMLDQIPKKVLDDSLLKGVDIKQFDDLYPLEEWVIPKDKDLYIRKDEQMEFTYPEFWESYELDFLPLDFVSADHRQGSWAESVMSYGNNITV